MINFPYKKSIAFTLISLLLNYNAYADTVPPITSANIMQDTMSAVPNCLHYQVVGACYWLSQYGTVSSTPYVKHYLPDVVVSVFNKPGDNAWQEMNDTVDQAGKNAEEQIVSSITNDDEIGRAQNGWNQQQQNPL